MDGNYKLHVKIGDSEFDSEGPEATVKDAYERFLSALNAPSSSQSVRNRAKEEEGAAASATPGSLRNSGVDSALLETAFEHDETMVSLRHLPPADNPNRAADAAILLLYGYRMLLRTESVPVTWLNDALRKSGISVTRLDRFIGVHSQLYMKGGQKSGGRYTLNNQGIRTAEMWLNQWFR